jgi:hypothetical protein
MKHKYIVTAILFNIRKDGITPKALKAAKADENVARLNIEQDSFSIAEVSVPEVTRINERILAVTYYVDVESVMPKDEVIDKLKDVTNINCDSEDYVLVNYSAVSFNL